jgi:hypothetical protein
MWYFDFIMALSAFTLMLFFVFKFTSIGFTGTQQTKSTVLEDAQRLSESFLSTGIPLNWTEEDVISLGLLFEDSSIDLVKIMKLQNLTLTNYERSKYIIGIKSDYLLYFETINGTSLNLTNQTYIGKPGASVQEVIDNNPGDKTTFTRYVVYRQDSTADILAMNVLVWNQ